MHGIHYKAPGQCPVCGEQLIISKLSCKNCHTSIDGAFSSCKFCQLPKEQLDFIETFIQCRGNIKDVEKELNISYPTVRKNLDMVIQSLGYQMDKPDQLEKETSAWRQETLEALERGEITPKDAVKRLRDINK